MKRRGKKNPAFDKRALRKDIAKAQREESRAKIRALRAEGKAAAKASCSAGRARAKETRAQAIEAAKAKGREARAAAKASCVIAKSAHRAAADREKKDQADLRRIERANKQKRPGLAPARVRQGESDDEVRQNIAPELVPLFERVKRQIKAGPRMSRTEAFQKYAEEHPREAYAAAEDATDALIRDLEARQRRANPGALDYAATHGGKRGDWSEKTVRVPDPRKRLTVLGRLRKVEYETEKGDGVAVYFHTFGREFSGASERGAPKEDRMPWLAFTPDGGLVVAGGRYSVKAEGIVG